MSFTVNSYGPFPDHNAFHYYSVEYLEPSDIARAACVCKRWNQLFTDQKLWKALFEKEGIPLVISSNGTERNYKEDFKTLYPITSVSGRVISELLGKVVEKIPPITEERFNELKEPDPFEEGKLKRETFVFIVDPAFVMRAIETPLALDHLGNLTASTKQESEQNPVKTNTTEKSELKIPLSLQNIKVLSSYPLNGKENMPVFSQFSSDEVFQQCNTRPDKIGVYFMRRHVVIDQSRKQLYAEHEKLAKNKGFEVTPLRVRVLFDTVVILEDGTCPDARESQWTWIYSLHPETVRYLGNHVFPSVVGGFAPRAGVNVDYCSYQDDALIGVAPGKTCGIPAIGT